MWRCGDDVMFFCALTRASLKSYFAKTQAADSAEQCHIIEWHSRWVGSDFSMFVTDLLGVWLGV